MKNEEQFDRKRRRKIEQAIQILMAIGMPAAQLNDRTAICLLAILNITVNKKWTNADNPKLGIRGILDFARTNMKTNYAENTRESIRKHSVKQLVEAGVLLHNPDDPKRAVNSSKNYYQVDDSALQLFKKFGKVDWEEELEVFLSKKPTLISTYAKSREMSRIKVRTEKDLKLTLSPGKHSNLIKQVIEEFAERFTPGGELLYVGDTGSKFGFFNEKEFSELGVKIESHGKMPDVVIYFREKKWLILVEAVASSGPVDGSRHSELSHLFGGSKVGLVFVTAFPDRGELFRKFVSVVAWETEVWCASDPSHLIHFNGARFLGPY